jgi:hypothetical protein
VTHITVNNERRKEVGKVGMYIFQESSARAVSQRFTRGK